MVRSWLMFDYVLTFLIFFIWWIVYYRAKKTCLPQPKEDLLKHLNKLRFWLWPAKIMTVLKFAAGAVLWNADWAFVEDKVFIQWPLYALSISAVFFFSLPLLTSRKLSELHAKLNDGSSGYLNNRILAAPFSAAFYAAACSCLYMLFLSQSPLRFSSFITVWIAFGILMGMAWVSRRRQFKEWQHSLNMDHRVTYKQRLIRFSWKCLLVIAITSIMVSAGLISSRLPDRMSMMDHGRHDSSGRPGNHSHHGNHAEASSISAENIESISVASLRGPQTSTPDRTFELSAQKKLLTMPSGETEEVWAFNGLVPGPELRIQEGELVEVNLVNIDVEDGVTIHWHGLNVPNGEDGVAGLTQNAVMPGERFIYRFIAEQTGTYWYHSHQQSSVQVAKGLYGTLVIEPDDATVLEDVDLTVMAHPKGTSNGTTLTLGATGKLQRQTVMPGKTVRLRLINAHNMPKMFYLSGASFKVTSIDGVDLNGPEWIQNQKLLLAAGGRYDISFAMPDHAVSLTHAADAINERSEAIVMAGNDRDPPLPGREGPVFNPAKYGTPSSVPFDADTVYDRNFTLVLDNRVGFYNGTMTNVQTINGYVFPNTPSLMVREGDIVKMKFVNRGFIDHPMHLHGHHILVLKRNGEPVVGSPWWTDTLNVAPGETYEAAFEADNPGLWMDHCHNLDHAAAGMSMHLMYEGVYTPYEIGSATVNKHE